MEERKGKRTSREISSADEGAAIDTLVRLKTYESMTGKCQPYVYQDSLNQTTGETARWTLAVLRQLSRVYGELQMTCALPLSEWITDWLLSHHTCTPFERKLARACMLGPNVTTIEDTLVYLCTQKDLEKIWEKVPTESTVTLARETYAAYKTYTNGHLCVELRRMQRKNPTKATHHPSKFLLSFEVLVITVKEGILNNNPVSAIQQDIEQDWMPADEYSIKLTYFFVRDRVIPSC